MGAGDTVHSTTAREGRHTLWTWNLAPATGAGSGGGSHDARPWDPCAQAGLLDRGSVLGPQVHPFPARGLCQVTSSKLSFLFVTGNGYLPTSQDRPGGRWVSRRKASTRSRCAGNTADAHVFCAWPPKTGRVSRSLPPAPFPQPRPHLAWRCGQAVPASAGARTCGKGGWCGERARPPPFLSRPPPSPRRVLAQPLGSQGTRRLG